MYKDSEVSHFIDLAHLLCFIKSLRSRLTLSNLDLELSQDDLCAPLAAPPADLDYCKCSIRLEGCYAQRLKIQIDLLKFESVKFMSAILYFFESAILNFRIGSDLDFWSLQELCCIKCLFMPV